MKSFNLKQAGATQGFAIIEALVSIVCITILIGSTAAYIGNRLKEQNVLTLQAAKARIVQTMELALNDPENIKNAIDQVAGVFGPTNAQVKQCILYNYPCPSVHLNANSPQPMDFYLPDGKGIGGQLLLNSRWSSDGTPQCIPIGDGSNCPFDVRVHFWFTCRPIYSGPVPPACLDTSHLNMAFLILPWDPPVAAARGLNLYHPRQPTPGNPLNYVDFAFSVDVKNLRQQLASELCLGNHQIQSYNANTGKVVCTCINNKPRIVAGVPQLDAAGRPICENNDCPAGQYLRGFNVSNGQAVCASSLCTGPMPAAGAFQCPIGFYVSEMTYGSCTTSGVVNNSDKKGASRSNVNCTILANCCRVF